MIDKTQRKATAKRNGNMIVIYMTGGSDCLWLNMYLDTQDWQMTCDSDIGSYAYHWGRPGSAQSESFIQFCCRWLYDDEWLLRKCIGERRIEKDFDAKKTRENIINDFRENGYDDADFHDLDAALDCADIYYDNRAAWTAVFQECAESLDIELPDEWRSNIAEDYTPWQKRFAEICREVIVPEIERVMFREERETHEND